ncbi:MAG: hypothetical protein JWN99_2759 [Ilumatobacteraceae bacterium]|nr:hypothetical protein [Ilumatobacteraceae bacterium]
MGASCHARSISGEVGPTSRDVTPIPCPPVQPSDKSPVVVWTARVVWLVTAVFGGSAIGQALAGHSRAVQQTGTVMSWAGWAAVAIAIVVPSTIGLTVVRTVVPASVVVAVMAAFGGADAAAATICVGSALLMSALVVSGEFGQTFAQGSAYGHERRFVLRPPVAFLLPAVVTWCVLCAAAISGPLLLAAHAWFAGVPVTLIAVAGGWFLGRRFHMLSRRWLVLVPAGLVVHDQLVLSETVMFPRASLAQVGLALEGTQAADLTGPAAGHAVEVALLRTETVVLARTRAKPNGTALHVRSVLVAPTRPGRMLRAAADGQIPVG